MQNKKQFQNLLFHTISRAATAALAMAIVFALTVVLTQAAQAQTFKVIYAFTGGADGAWPYAGLTMDRVGNLYGTTQNGGKVGCGSGSGCGTVFKLSHKGSGWVFTPLYTFQAGSDGAVPTARVIFGPDGNLYGTTSVGGAGYGTVFKLQPSPVACKTALCPWTETVLYRFTGGSDGGSPQNGDLLFDQSGIIYGTTQLGGSYGLGVVFSLTPSKGAWTESVLYDFTGGNDGQHPFSGVISDNFGNLYGTASYGGSGGGGTVYELLRSGSGWQEKTLYSFPTQESGYAYGPVGGLIFDRSGNLYGTTVTNSFGEGPSGTVYELTPSNGNWTITHVAGLIEQRDGEGPVASLVMDAAGNLYGAYTPSALYEPGAVFKVPSDWYPIYLGGFSADNGDMPYGSVILDASGNIYGTASVGGLGQGYEGFGTVWEITP